MAITTLISRTAEVLRALRGLWMVIAVVALMAAATSTAHAQTYTVSVSNDDGTGGTMNTLSWAILQANNNGSGTIDVTVDTTLSGSLLAINDAGTVTISGNNHIVDAVSNQAFTVAQGTAFISDLTVKNALAQGGAGGSGNGGGGGGLGAGGALYIGDNNAMNVVNVTISNVTFQNNQAQGGAGGTGDGTSANGGNGGGYDANANSPTAGTGGATGSTGSGLGGGYGGGGAGSGSSGTAGGAGNGGGDGGAPGVGGGGGLALGGAVFVANGSSLTITNSTNADNTNSVVGGAGGTGAAGNGTTGSPNGGAVYVGIGSTAVFDNSGSNVTISGNIYSNGQITISGTATGVVYFTGNTTNSSLSTGTNVDSGTLSGNTNSLEGTLTNSGTIIFDQSTTGTFNGSINGSGNVRLVGTGLVIFSAANSYTGGTSVEAGTLQGTTSNIQGNIVNDTNVTFNQNFSGTYAGNISGPGSLTITSSGTVFMTGVNSSTGPTTVSSGIYSLDSTTSSAITVSQSATLAGTGVVNNNVTNFGNISPGNSGIGTLTINGNYSAQSTSTFIVDINNAGTTPGVNNDLVQVNGNVALGDGQVQVHGGTSTYTTGSRYYFLEYSGSRNGTFSSITDDMPFFDTSLVYGSNYVAFDIFRSTTAYASIAQNFNQLGVATYLDQQANGSMGAFSSFYDLINSQTTAGAQSAFQQLEGEVNATAAQLMVQDTVYMYLLLRRGANGQQPIARAPTLRDTADEYALAPADGEDDIILVNTRATPAIATDGDAKLPEAVAQARQRLFRRAPRRQTYWTGWTTGYGVGGDAFTNGNAGGATYGFGGSIVALDRAVSEVLKFGIFGAYNHLELKVANPAQYNQANDGQFGTYLRAADDVKHFLFAGSVGFDTYNSRRTLNIGTFSNNALANYNGWQASSYGEFGITKSGWFTDWQPFVGMQYIYVRQNAFTETGADPVNLQVAGTNTHALRNLLGTRASWSCYTDRCGRIAPELRAIWLHEYLNPETSLNSTFAGVGGAGFATKGLNFGRDWAVLGGGITCFANECTSVAINYDLQVNAVQAFHVGSGTYTRRW